MPETCIIILVLSGIALVANVAICLYTLHFAKQSEHRQYMEGFTSAFLCCETLSDTPQENNTPENPDTKTKEE